MRVRVRAELASDGPSCSCMPAVECLQRRQLRVAVIGAGAAGLVAARELRREGHAVVVYEAADEVGGTWRYSERAGPDTHSSLYRSLRTNLPRDLMAFADFPFTHPFAGDARRFCGHAEVQAYLLSFAREFHLRPLIRFSTAVVHAAPVLGSSGDGDRDGGGRGTDGDAPPHRWRVTSVAAAGGEATAEELYDALVVANGHYAVPRMPVPPIAGLDSFRGCVLHSHDYREPDARFSEKRCLVVGAAASGEDISAELGAVAATVLLSGALAAAPQAAPDASNVRRVPPVRRFVGDAVEFVDGSRETVDVVMLATGYQIEFPFLREAECGVRVEDNHVAPLFEHLLVPRWGARLAFIGLPWRVVPFPLFELQAAAVARLLSGAAPMPSKEEMERGAAAAAARLRPHGGDVEQRHAHRMTTADEQYEYSDRVAHVAGIPRQPPWRKRAYIATGEHRREHGVGRYRDVEMRDNHCAGDDS